MSHVSRCLQQHTVAYSSATRIPAASRRRSAVDCNALPDNASISNSELCQDLWVVLFILGHCPKHGMREDDRARANPRLTVDYDVRSQFTASTDVSVRANKAERSNLCSGVDSR